MLLKKEKHSENVDGSSAGQNKYYMTSFILYEVWFPPPKKKIGDMSQDSLNPHTVH